MSKIVVIGGGWAGCSAALTAGLAGEEVYLLERSDICSERVWPAEP